MKPGVVSHATHVAVVTNRLFQAHVTATHAAFRAGGCSPHTDRCEQGAISILQKLAHASQSLRQGAVPCTRIRQPQALQQKLFRHAPVARRNGLLFPIADCGTR